MDMSQGGGEQRQGQQQEQGQQRRVFDLGHRSYSTPRRGTWKTWSSWEDPLTMRPLLMLLSSATLSTLLPSTIELTSCGFCWAGATIMTHGITTDALRFSRQRV